MPEPTVNEQLRRVAVRHKIDVIRRADLITRELKFLETLKSDVQDYVRARLEAIKRRGLSAIPLKRSQNLLSWIKTKTADLNKEFNQELKPYLAAAARDEVIWQEDVIQAITGTLDVTLDLNRPANDLLTALVTEQPLGGKLMTEYTETWSSSLRDKLAQEVRLGLLQGQTVEAIVDRLAPVLETSQAGARAIVHTTVSGVTSAARDYMFQENEDVVKGVQWVATLDSRTTELCRGLDGQVFPLHSGPRPPGHFNCRSTTVPVLRSWRELGIDLNEMPVGTRPTVRDSLAGDIPATQTYDDWLRTQDVAFQKKELGPKKYELWSKGELTLDKFVNSADLTVYTLDQLKTREPAAWQRAFGG